MDTHRYFFIASCHFVQLYGGIYNNIRGCYGRQIGKHHEKPDDAAAPKMAAGITSPRGAGCPALRYGFIQNIGSRYSGLHHRVQHHGPFPLFRSQPLPGQKVCQRIAAAAAIQLHLYIVVIRIRRIHHKGRGHNHNHIGPALVIEPNAVVFIQHRHQTAYIQRIAIPLQIAVVPADNDRFFQFVGLQVIYDIGVAIDIVVCQFGVQFGLNCFRVLFSGQKGSRILLLDPGGRGLRRLHRECACRAHNRCVAGQDSVHTEPQGIPILGDSNVFVGSQLLGKCDIPYARRVADSAVGLYREGIVDLLPLAAFFVMDGGVIHRGHTQTVAH